MEGPTPVSALIHAATMVAAGVYLVGRAYPIFTPEVLLTIAYIGGITLFVAASTAVVQNDIKKVLAYSTVSQLGYMFLAVGCGAYTAAMFHMITHAMFKALLFLGAGAVIHGMHDEQDMRRMGGLRKFMPLTAGTFIVGWLAIAGIPPFAGFWSKDEILTAAWDKSILLWAVGFVTALLTAFYMSRQVFLVFFGGQRWNDEVEPASDQSAHAADADQATDGGETSDAPVVTAHAHGHGDPHDPPWTMAVPLVILAVLAFLAGIINLPFTEDTKRLEQWLAPVLEGVQHNVDVAGALQVVLAVGTALLCLGAILLARRVYLQRKVPAERFEPQLFAHAWYYDETVSAFVGGPGEEAFEATARFDKGIIDGAVNGVAAIVQWVASKLRLTQTGYVRNYALGIAVGAFILVGLFLTKAGG
jgi:NADH-quinone oxidoreductase subunit L